MLHGLFNEVFMEAFLQSMTLVAFAEMGDKTQLLALVLNMRYGKPKQIMAGIFCATLLNHGLASWFGGWLAKQVSPHTLQDILAAGFIAFAFWILIPDKEDDEQRPSRFGPFVTTLTLFFLAEIGDKTQIATTFLAANYGQPLLVTCGTTTGMMIADGLAIAFGGKLMSMVSLKYLRWIAAAGFLAFGIWILTS
jgi:putative Ca2+/H+ antiporter (TMEM165/GDT1 family)